MGLVKFVRLVGENPICFIGVRAHAASVDSACTERSIRFMERRAQGFAAVLTLVVVLSSGYLLARAASGMMRLLDDTATGLPAGQPIAREHAVSLAEPHYDVDFTDALAPLADAATKTATGVAPELRGSAQDYELDRIAACDAGLRLLGSVVNAEHPDRSLAAVAVRGGTQVLRTGERIGDSLLVSLRPMRAYLRDLDGSTCMLRVTPERVARPAPLKSAGARAGARKPELSVAELTAGIRNLGGDAYAVSRSLLEQALGNPAALRRSARLQVVKKDGRVEGVRLSTLKAQSPLTFLGLQKGDVIRKLNGFDLADPAGALQALSMLKSQRNVSLALLRGGAPRTLTYAVD